VSAIDLLSFFKGGKKNNDNVSPVSEDKAKDYLPKFGYVGPSELLNRARGFAHEVGDVFKSAVRKFQDFAGLEPTGVLDVKTRKKMAEPRCGVYDVQAITSGREAAFKWRKSRLTYSILSFSSDLPRRDIDAAIRKAFDTWSAVVPLDFTEVSSNDPSADIKIKFASGNHDDPWPFDGRGGVLAHATMPTSGLLHFDEDENWVYMDARKIATYSYTDLLPVAIHEIGHVLGLSHSRSEDSIMAPFYQETVDASGRYVMPTLRSTDINAIQEIYGPRRGGFSSSSSSRGGWGDSDSGSSSRFTTEGPTTHKHGLGSSLKGLFGRWLGGGSRDDPDPDVSSSGRSRTHTREISPATSGDGESDSGSSSRGECPSTVDAFTPGLSGTNYVFLGSKVYEMRGSTVIKVHSMRLLFPNGPIYVDAAMSNERNQVILLFQSSNVYAFRASSSGKFALEQGYPKRVPRELGFNPTGALLWNDGHQLLLSRSDDFAVYDEYWNQATVVSTLSAHFPGFPRGIRGGFTSGGSEMTLFSSSQVYKYDANRKMALGSGRDLRSYLNC
jgi:hypothetical protein